MPKSDAIVETNNESASIELTPEQLRAASSILARQRGALGAARAKEITATRNAKHHKELTQQALKRVLGHRAVGAVKAGLGDETDNYKRAAIGVKTLQGLGLFNADQMNIAINMERIPDNMKAQFAGLDATAGSTDEAIDIVPEATPRP